jgi:transposase
MRLEINKHVWCVCGSENENLALSETEWTWPDCGTHHHRDKNISNF